MPAEEIPRVMQPFEQTELGKTKEGTGLGLPPVQRIAELHGGEFVLQSALGEGTVATILLPVDCTADALRIKPLRQQANQLQLAVSCLFFYSLVCNWRVRKRRYFPEIGLSE